MEKVNKSLWIICYQRFYPVDRTFTNFRNRYMKGIFMRSLCSYVKFPQNCFKITLCVDGPGSSVGIVTELQAGRSGDRIPVWVWFSASVQPGPRAHKFFCTMGIGPFPGVKRDWVVTLTPNPLLVLWSRKSRAIPLLTLWAVRTVQSLIACTVQLNP